MAKIDFRTNQEVRLYARVAKDPVYKKVGQNLIPHISLTLTTHKAFKKKGKEEVEYKTSWHYCVAWNEQANYINLKAPAKGDFVSVVGEINQNTYVDSNQQTQYSFEILINSFNIIVRAPAADISVNDQEIDQDVTKLVEEFYNETENEEFDFDNN